MWLTERDLIIPIGYTTLRDRLADATRAAVEEAAEYWQLSPDAYVAFASASHAFPGSDVVESLYKVELLLRAGIPVDRIKYAGPITNTARECLLIKKVLAADGIKPKSIIAFADILHTRSVGWVLHRVFPDADIVVCCIAADAVQSDHPLPLQRTRIGWVATNFCRQLFFWVFGLWPAKYISQPVAPS